MTLGPTTLVAAADTSSDPFNLRIAWSGAALGLFWPQDDGSIVLQRVDAGGVATGAPVTVVPAGGSGQVVPSGVLGTGAGYFLTWGVQQADGGFDTFAGALTQDGATSGGPTLLYTGSGYDVGARLAQRGGQTFALWGTHPATDPSSPVTTTFASVDPTNGTVLAAQTADKGVDHSPTAIAATAEGQDVAVYLADEMRATILSRPLAGGGFTQRASIDATDTVALAVDPCGHLAALVPVGAYEPSDPLSTGLAVQRIGAQGTLGDPLMLPVGSDYVESWDITEVDGGVAVVWIEGHQAAPGRSLHLAYVAMP
jgi:hypothetical protein